MFWLEVLLTLNDCVFALSNVMVRWHEAQVSLLQLLANIFLRSSQAALLNRVSFATDKHVVDVGEDVVLNIDMVIPVLLC